VSTATLLQFLFSGLMVGAIYGLVALGLNIVFNATGDVNRPGRVRHARRHARRVDPLGDGPAPGAGRRSSSSTTCGWSWGLAPLVVREIMRLLAALREAGTAMLLVEQDARMALRAADRAYVLETGSVVLAGSGADLRDNDELKAVYLGG